MKEKVCADCDKLAKWFYMPGSEVSEKDRYCCDDCVPRGCSCNFELKEDAEPTFDEEGNFTNPYDDYEQMKDDNGRYLPCCEWWEIEK